MTYTPPPPEPSVEENPAEPAAGFDVPLGDDAVAMPPDDDSRWRAAEGPASGGSGEKAQLQRCEEGLLRAMRRERPRRLIDAILSNGCTALSQSERDCARCRICPSAGEWQHIGGYFNAQKGRVVICAEKEPSEEEIEATLTHELVHAYDHCRYAMTVPFVGGRLLGRQAPWALTCPAAACSEVRAYLLGNFWQPATGAPPPLAPPASRPFGGAFGAAPAAGGGDPVEAAATHRYAIFLSALTSSSVYGICAAGDRHGVRGLMSPPAPAGGAGAPGAAPAEESRAHRALQRVFNACLADFAPFDGTPSGSGFPPMPAAVEQAAAEAGAKA